MEKLEQELDERKASERQLLTSEQALGERLKASEEMCEKLQGELAAQFEHAARQTKALHDARDEEHAEHERRVNELGEKISTFSEFVKSENKVDARLYVETVAPVLASLQAAVDTERALCQERGRAWRTDALDMAQRRAGEAEARLAEARKAHKAQLTTAAAAVAESREETNRAQRASLSELQERLTEAGVELQQQKQYATEAAASAREAMKAERAAAKADLQALRVQVRTLRTAGSRRPSAASGGTFGSRGSSSRGGTGGRCSCASKRGARRWWRHEDVSLRRRRRHRGAASRWSLCCGGGCATSTSPSPNGAAAPASASQRQRAAHAGGGARGGGARRRRRKSAARAAAPEPLPAAAPTASPRSPRNVQCRRGRRRPSVASTTTTLVAVEPAAATGPRATVARASRRSNEPATPGRRRQDRLTASSTPKASRTCSVSPRRAKRRRGVGSRRSGDHPCSRRRARPAAGRSRGSTGCLARHRVARSASTLHGTPRVRRRSATTR